MKQDVLALRDIHLPSAISWWPPAIGWWLLLMLAVVIVVVIVFSIRRMRRPPVLKSGRSRLKAIAADDAMTDLEKLQQISILLRRVAISLAPRRSAAGLAGAQWLQYLDRSVPGAPFSNGVGRCLADQHYRQSVNEDVDMDALIGVCEQWLKAQKT